MLNYMSSPLVLHVVFLLCILHITDFIEIKDAPSLVLFDEN
jgi:hypothetical protein